MNYLIKKHCTNVEENIFMNVKFKTTFIRRDGDVATYGGCGITDNNGEMLYMMVSSFENYFVYSNGRRYKDLESESDIIRLCLFQFS